MKRKIDRWMAALLLLSACMSVQAGQTGADQPVERQPAAGEATRLWLDRQSQGSQASAKAQTLPGPAMEKIYERYLKSYTHPIPEHFERENLGAGTSR